MIQHDLSTSVGCFGCDDNEASSHVLAMLLDEMDRDIHVSKELSNVVEEDSAFDSPDFSAIGYVNQRFPTEESLIDIDNVINELNAELTKLDAKIATIVRNQSSVMLNLNHDLQQLRSVGTEIGSQLDMIQQESQISEARVDEVSRDVRALDRGKLNLTSTIGSLKRLTMLITALDQLRRLAAEREYKEVMNLVLATCGLVAKFKQFSSLPEMMELLDQHQSLLRELRAQILEDFDALFDPDAVEAIPPLLDAAKIADVIPGRLRSEILFRFTERILDPYRRLFSTTAITPTSAISALESFDRRFSWLKRTLRDVDAKYSQHFPAIWNVPCLISIGFCRQTREHLIDILSAASFDPPLLIQALQKCKDFEQYLIQTFQDITPGSSAHVTELLKDLERRDKDDFSLLGNIESSTRSSLPYPEVLEGEVNGSNTQSETEPTRARFSRILSECFDAYLAPWIRLEEQRLMETLTQATSNETETIIGDSDIGQGEIPKLMYSSAIDLLAAMKSSLKKCTHINSDELLIGIFKTFKKIINQYTLQLSARLPKSLKLGTNSHNVVCAVLGTSDYVDGTLPHIIDAVMVIAFDRAINEHSKDDIEFDNERDTLWNLKSRGLNLLINSVQSTIDQYLTRMSAQNWTKLLEVEDASLLIEDIEKTLIKEMISASRGLSIPLYRLFCDTFVQWMVSRFSDAVYACEQISPLGAQQLLLDASALKSKLLEIPVRASGGISVSTVYTKIVMRELGKVEVLLKILTSSASSPETLQELLIENGGVSSKEELRKALRLRSSFKPSEQPTASASSNRGPSTSLHHYRPTPPLSGSGTPDATQ